MKYYIDFDEVIEGTADIMFEKYNDDFTDQVLIREHVIKCNWNDILNRSDQINNAYYYINNSDKDIYILTKCHSMEEEIEKVFKIRSKGIKCPIICTPYCCNKSDMVNPVNSVLVDDQEINLEDWESKGGISYLFCKNTNVTSDRFLVVYDLSFLCDKKVMVK